MNILNILAIAVALAMDAFAVSIAVGIGLKKVSFRQMFRLSWHFGFFQAFMPVFGWMLGFKVRSLIENYDHWVAFILLVLVGGKMLFEAVFDHHTDESVKNDPTKSMTLVMLSVATSIDALAVGFSMSVLNVSIIFPAVIIGIVALLFTVFRLKIGTRFGASAKLSRYAALIGGVVLFCIGLNILYEHGALF